MSNKFSELPKKAQEWLSKDLDGMDKIRIQKIKWRKVDGKYFSYFEDYEKAYLYLAWVAHRYKHSAKNTLLIKDIVDEAQSYGINLYPTKLGQWFRNVFEIDVYMAGGFTTEVNRRTKSFFLDEEVIDVFKQLNRHSKFLKTKYMNIICRFMMGLEFDAVVIIFEDSPPITILEHSDDYYAITFVDLPSELKRYIDGLVYDAKEHGFEYIVKKARANGYTVIT